MVEVFEYLRELNMAAILFRLLLAMFAGGILGLERARKRRPADSRTYMLVCTGAALAMLLGLYLYYMVTGEWAGAANELGVKTDISRFGAQVINGIGFLGAGTVLVNSKQQVKGVTTSAGLWASACMGLAIGAGFYECVILGVALMFLVMRLLPMLEDAIIEKAPYLNVYAEFDSWENLSTIIGCIKNQGEKVIDIDMDVEGSGFDKDINPSAVFYIQLTKKRPHSSVLIELACLDCVYTVDEV